MNHVSSNVISQNFGEFQAFVKNECEMGRCTKMEAIKAILDKAQEIILSLRVPTSEEENMYQARSIN